MPLMVATVVTLLWYQVPSVVELTRMLNRKDLLWTKAVSVSRQAVSERFLSFPYRLFEQVFQWSVSRQNLYRDHLGKSTARQDLV